MGRFCFWLLVTEDEVSRYERDVFPHPLRYYVKDYVYEKMPPVIPTVNQIPTKFKTFAEIYARDNKEEIDIYKCDLCGDILRNDDEYSQHVKTRHL